MRKILPVILVALLFLSAFGCAGVQWKSGQSTEVAVDIAASTCGYYVGKNNPDRVPDWIGEEGWVTKVLEFEAGDSVLSYEELLAEGFDLVVDEPFLKMQFEKLLRLLEFPELQPPNVPFLTSEYVKMVRVVLGGFSEGLMVGEKEANK